MPTPEQQWNAYMAAFGATDAAERARLLEQCVCDDVVFTNPGGSGRTRAGLAAHIAEFQAKMPGMAFGTDKVFLHHGALLAAWSMYKADRSKVAAGYNFVTLDAAGRFSYMAGFF